MSLSHWMRQPSPRFGAVQQQFAYPGRTLYNGSIPSEPFAGEKHLRQQPWPTSTQEVVCDLISSLFIQRRGYCCLGYRLALLWPGKRTRRPARIIGRGASRRTAGAIFIYSGRHWTGHSGEASANTQPAFGLAGGSAAGANGPGSTTAEVATRAGGRTIKGAEEAANPGDISQLQYQLRRKPRSSYLAPKV